MIRDDHIIRMDVTRGEEDWQDWKKWGRPHANWCRDCDTLVSGHMRDHIAAKHPTPRRNYQDRG